MNKMFDSILFNIIIYIITYLCIYIAKNLTDYVEIYPE